MQEVAFRGRWIYVALRPEKPGEYFGGGGERHEATNRVSVVHIGWNWFGAHDAGGEGAFLGQRTAISTAQSGAIERSAAPVCR